MEVIGRACSEPRTVKVQKRIFSTKEFVVSTSIVIIIKEVGLRSMRVKHIKKKIPCYFEIVVTFPWLCVCQPHQALLN